MTPGLSKDIQCHVWPHFSKLANHQIRHQTTHKVGCPPGDCIWSLQSSSGVCVGMHGLMYSLYHPRICFQNCKHTIILTTLQMSVFLWKYSYCVVHYTHDLKRWRDISHADKSQCMAVYFVTVHLYLCGRVILHMNLVGDLLLTWGGDMSAFIALWCLL